MLVLLDSGEFLKGEAVNYYDVFSLDTITVDGRRWADKTLGWPAAKELKMMRLITDQCKAIPILHLH